MLLYGVPSGLILKARLLLGHVSFLFIIIFLHKVELLGMRTDQLFAKYGSNSSFQLQYQLYIWSIFFHYTLNLLCISHAGCNWYLTHVELFIF